MIWNVIGTMRSSPLFGMSLGSKELFHSNLLWWLCRAYPAQMGEVFGEFLAEPKTGLVVKDCWREKRNIDLSVLFDNGEELLIENKVKSLPDPEQLDKYARENPDNKNLLLLALSEPAFLTDPLALSSRWKFLSYRGLGERLTMVSGSIEDLYHRMLTEDYVRITKGLDAISGESNIDFSRDTLSVFDEAKNRLLSELKSIRFQDWYVKRLCELIAGEAYSRLGRKMPGSTILRRGDEWKTPTGTFGVGSGMTRAQGLVDVFYFPQKGIRLNVQLQGDRLKKMISTEETGRCKTIGEKMRSWFDQPGIQMVTPDPRKEWYKYGDTTVYRYGIVSPDLKLSEIIEYMVEGICQAKSIFEGLPSAR